MSSMANMVGTVSSEPAPCASSDADSPQPTLPMSLSDPLDATNLAAGMCFVRQRIELFESTPDEIAARFKKGGLKQEIRPGQVGLRCAHCAHMPPSERANGAVTYPTNLSLVYQAVRNWQRYHFMKCPCISEELKEEYKSYKRQHSSKAIGQYWIDSCERKGLFSEETISPSSQKKLRAIFFDASKCQPCQPSATSPGDFASAAPSKVETTSSKAGATKKSQKKGSKTERRSSTGDSRKEKERQNQGNYESPMESSAKVTAANVPSFSIEEGGVLDGHIEEPYGDLLDDLNDMLDYDPPDVVSATRNGSSDPSIGTDIFSTEMAFPEDASRKNSRLLPHDSNNGEDALTTKPMDHRADNAFPLNAAGIEQFASTIDTASFENSLRDFSGEGNEDSLASISGLLDHLSNLNTPNKLQSNQNAHGDGGGNVAQGGPRSYSPTILEKVQLAYDIVQTTQEMSTFPDSNTDSQSSRNDLCALGKELYEHFSGMNPFGSTSTMSEDNIVEDKISDQQDKRKRRMGRGNFVPLREMGYPIMLCNLISNLCLLGDGKDDEHLSCVPRSGGDVHSVKDVLDELQLMIKNPGQYLVTNDTGVSNQYIEDGSLLFAEDKLYGREKEISDMVTVFDRVITSDGKCEVLTIVGCSGTGKTFLGLQLRTPVENRGGYFLRYKFDELQQVNPMSPILSALNNFCDQVCQRDKALFLEIKTSLETALGNDVKFLTPLIPNLRKIMDDVPEEAKIDEEVESRSALIRLAVLLRQFFKAIAQPSRPLILFLDDLQWADPSSLSLLREVLIDGDITSFLVVGCFRSNEVSDSHLLKTELHAVAEAGVAVKEISIENFDRQSVNRLISDTLHISPLRANSLADLVYSKTSGLPLFVVQFIKSLHDEGLLRFSLSSREWHWDIDAISSKKLADNVAELMANKILSYSADVLQSLKLVSCLGNQCEQSTLDVLGPSMDETEGLSRNLNVAISDGLITKSGKIYTFAHDQIQQAVYSLVAVDERAYLHLQIGRVLVQRSSQQQLDDMIFVVVDQFGRASGMIEDQKEKMQLAYLYLKAGKKAQELFAFLPASILLLQGTQYLEDSSWETDYDLALELYQTLAEVRSVMGSRDEVEVAANVVFAKAKSLGDKFSAYYSLILAIGEQAKLAEAIALGFEVVEQLGFPMSQQADVSETVEQTRILLAYTNDDAVLGREMHDTNALAAMKLLTYIQRYTFFHNHDLMALVICSMVRITIEHGICGESATAMASFGHILGSYGQMSLAYSYSKLGLSILARFKSKRLLSQAYLAVYVQVFPIEPIQANISQIDFAYNEGMACGDVEGGLTCLNRSSAMRFFYGEKLQKVVTATKEAIAQMRSYKKKLLIPTTSLLLQASLNLMDINCEDPTTVSGEIINQTEALQHAEQTNNMSTVSLIYRLRLFLSYVFGDFDLAGNLYISMQGRMNNRRLQNAMILHETLYSGLVAAELARTRDRDKWRPIALSTRDKLKDWARTSPWNCDHGLRFIEAEIAYLDGNLSEANQAYQDAATIAAANRFIGDQAVCLERAALFHENVSNGNSPLAAIYLKQARNVYLEWGATRKAMTLVVD